MSTNRHDGSRRGGCHGRGAIKGTFQGVANVFGVSKGVVITGFVLGWIFAPLLTTIVFLGAMYWMSHPDETRRQVDRFSAQVRRTAERVSDATFGRADRYHHPATAPHFEDDAADTSEPKRPTSAEELKRRFKELDRRAKKIEEVVASEEYRLEREFRRIDD